MHRFSKEIREVHTIAHRGCGDGTAPENTVEAFEHALDCGIDMIELDVWLTKDSQVVVFHDHSLRRMCGVDGDVMSTRYDELPRVRIVGDDGQRGTSARIPLFSEVLDRVPDTMPMIVEFKQDSQELIDKCLVLLRQHGRTSGGVTFWFSLKQKILDRLRATSAELGTITSVPEMLFVYFLYYTGLLPFVPLRAAIVGIPIDKVNFERARENLPSYLPDFVCHLFTGDPPPIFLTPRLFGHLRSRGMASYFLGVNSMKGLRLAQAQGAAACLSDRPKWLVDAMRSKNVQLSKVM